MAKNLIKTGKEILSEHMTLEPKQPIVGNIKELRKILSVDTLIEEINQEEAIEFLDALDLNICDLNDTIKDCRKKITSLEKDIEKKDKEIEELKEEAEDWEDKARGAGFIMVRIENLQQEQLLSDFVNTRIWPNYNQQKDNVILWEK